MLGSPQAAPGCDTEDVPDKFLFLFGSEVKTQYLEFRDGSVPPLAARPATDDVMTLQILRVTLHVPVEVLGIVPSENIRKHRKQSATKEAVYLSWAM